MQKVTLKFDLISKAFSSKLGCIQDRKAMTIDEEHVYLQLYARAPAPSRDYYGLTVSSNFVILNIWNISHGPHVYPKRLKSPLNEFHEHKYLQCEVRRLFGEHVLNFAVELASKKRNLQHLPSRIFLRILRLLAAHDILRLSQTSKIFFELCNTEAAWKIIFRKRVKKSVLLRDVQRAESIGWKAAVKEKLSFMMHTRKNILSKQAPTGNKVTNVTKTIEGRKVPNNVTSSVQPKKPNTNPKKIELNNKLPSVHLTGKKPEVNVIKNVDREIKTKTAKSVGQLKTANEKSGIKNVPVHQKSTKMNPQNVKSSMNRSAARVFSKLPETGDDLKGDVLKNNLRKKDLCKSAQVPKALSKFQTKF